MNDKLTELQKLEPSQKLSTKELVELQRQASLTLAERGLLPNFYSPVQILETLRLSDFMGSPFKKAELEKGFHNLLLIYVNKNESVFEAISWKDYEAHVSNCIADWEEDRKKAKMQSLEYEKKVFFTLMEPKKTPRISYPYDLSPSSKNNVEFFYCHSESEDPEKSTYLPNAYCLQYLNGLMSEYL